MHFNSDVFIGSLDFHLAEVNYYPVRSITLLEIILYALVDVTSNHNHSVEVFYAVRLPGVCVPISVNSLQGALLFSSSIIFCLKIKSAQSSKHNVVKFWFQFQLN